MNKKYMEQSPSIFREFFGYMETIKGKSANTVDGYFIDLRSFFRFYKRLKGKCPTNTELKAIDVHDVDLEMCSEVTFHDVLEFLSFASSDLNNNPATRSRKCSALRSFFDYLTTKTGQLENNPVENLNNPKLRSSLPRFLTLEQSFDILQSVSGENRERDYCILTLFLNCGMRLSELVGINYQDILPDSRLRLRGKGDKERIVYLNAACVSAIDEYRKVRPVDGVIDKNALFLSKRKTRISPKTVQWLVKKHLGEIGLDMPGYSVHKLRHTAATLMYQNDVDLRVIKDILGHENLGTTQIYTHVSSQRMQEAVDSNPLSVLSKNKKDSAKRKSKKDSSSDCDT